MRRLILLLVVVALPLNAQTVTLLHFSDYHSHAQPFFSDRGADQGGVARAVRYLRSERERGALVFSGGDMINKGSPAWSDKYGCAEWPWFNGIVDAMAFGNHEADYGLATYEACAKNLAYPLLSANTSGFKPSIVIERGGRRIGVFAVAGKDFTQLVRIAGLTFTDAVTAARETVRDLRESQRVDAVVMIGHQHAEDDYALARAVPGIDVIFGTHSHLERELVQIPETKTWFISPGQYLTLISRVELRFDRGALAGLKGRLVPVDRRMREDRKVARQVERMQRDLENDPAYRDLFRTVGHLASNLTTRGLAARALEVMRTASKSDAAVSTASSFRQPLARGAVTAEELRAAMPYDNEIVTCSMSGDQLARLLQESERRKGSDSELLVAVPATIDLSASYRVATTDYVAGVAYKKFFDCAQEKTGLRVRDELRKTIAAK